MHAKQAAWKAMEQLVDEGLVLSIGLQDADIEDVTAVMEYARITPAVNSLEVHPGNRNDALLAFCRSQVSASHAATNLRCSSCVKRDQTSSTHLQLYIVLG